MSVKQTNKVFYHSLGVKNTKGSYDDADEEPEWKDEGWEVETKHTSR